MFGIVMDVTERKREEEALRLSEKKFSTVFHTSPDAVILTRREDGRYLEANSGFASISGFSLEEAIGRSSTELNLWADPSDRERFITEIEKNGTSRQVDIRFRRKDGSPLIGDISGCALDINNEPCLLSVVRDVSMQKETLQALYGSQADLRDVMDAIPVCLAVSDGTRIEYVNSTFVRLLGITADEIVQTVRKVT